MIQENGKKIGFGRAIKDYFRGYVDFKGRSTRAGYWWMQLFNGMILAGIGFLLLIGLIIDGITVGGDMSAFGFGNTGILPGSLLLIIFILGSILPSLALLTRRLRDVGMKNGAILLNLLLFGAAGLLHFLVTILNQVTAENIAVIVSLDLIFALFVFFFAVEFFIFSLLPTDYLLGEEETFWFHGTKKSEEK